MIISGLCYYSIKYNLCVYSLLKVIVILNILYEKYRKRVGNSLLVYLYFTIKGRLKILYHKNISESIKVKHRFS